MPTPDARTRSTVSLSPKAFSKSIPSRHLPQIFLSNVLYAFALYAGKEWLLEFDVGVFWVLMRVLACGGVGVLVWEGRTGQLAKRNSIEWSVLGMASLLLFVQQASLFTALYRLSSMRVAMYCLFPTFWTDASSSTIKLLTAATGIAVSVLTDSQLSWDGFHRILPGYGALVLHAAASTGFEHTLQVLSPSVGTRFAIAASVLGASAFALPLYVFRMVVLDFPSTPVLPLLSLAVLPMLAYSILFLTPMTARSLKTISLTPQHFLLSFPSTCVVGALLGPLAFNQSPQWTDIVIATCLFYGLFPRSVESLTRPPQTPTTRLLRSYIKSILANPESRKIFYFLMLNLCYMLVQMLYGVWTNSLGLISDAIHMAFDCMAIGVGLFASVMATWEPNERFTYGYARIETLSGFANGIFLILISIFIIFEAIQRILEPPEMNTNQLLFVSSLGLGVNLFGMFAMGGHAHHHHGHSHGHDHGHSHGHDHGSHSHSHDEGIEHSHDHGHNHHGHAHSHDDHGHPHSHGHGHDHESCDHGSHAFPAPPVLMCEPATPSLASPPPLHKHSSHGSQHAHSSSDSLHSHGHSESLHDHTHSHEHAHDGDDHHHHHHEGEDCTHHSQEDEHGHDHAHEHDHGQEHDHSHKHDDGHGHAHEMHAKTDSPARPTSLKRQFTGPAIKTKPEHFRTPSPSLSIPSSNGAPKHSHARKATLSAINPALASLQESPALSGSSGGGHHHHHDHEGHSHNMRGVFLHVMADTLGSVGVILSTLLIQFYGWTGFDPIASLFIAVLIAASVVPLVIDTGKVLCLDVGDREAAISEALSELHSLDGLAGYSSPRFWPKDAATYIGSIHLQLAPSAASFDPTLPYSSRGATYARIDRVVERVDALLKRRISGLEELVIQVEGGGAP
ncbi:hypothetical protein BD626DRAFT_487931 [Schizophyllum amplum]|uniref:Cation efflux protein transmembrane domain-containing protein n=1 Tax=Schizophyllum amplum TaxID=97359 RepID=A0A550CK75_9AGAR|nr:hypothetical protein BD626DRAFT_487931 [Auriculariopsis ampla]